MDLHMLQHCLTAGCGHVLADGRQMSALPAGGDHGSLSVAAGCGPLSALVADSKEIAFGEFWLCRDLLHICFGRSEKDGRLKHTCRAHNYFFSARVVERAV